MIGLVYLAWAPLGPQPLREFLRSSHVHPAGAEHQLIVVLNGAQGEEPRNADSGSGGEGLRAALPAELGDTEHRLIELERPVLDLPAYATAARQLQHERLCFLNSYSTILADGWLGQLSRALDDTTVGVAGATGSWESQAKSIRGKPVYWLYQLALLPHARRDYPRFPNPHIRTTAFMLDRTLLLEAGFEQATDKRDTYLLRAAPTASPARSSNAACVPWWSAATAVPTTSRSGPPAPPTAPGTSATCSSLTTAPATGSAPLRGCANGSRAMRGEARDPRRRPRSPAIPAG